MKHRIMAPINRIPPINIRRNRKPLTRPLSKCIRLVRARMCSQHMVLVDVIRIRFRTSRVVSGEAEGIEILANGDDW